MNRPGNPDENWNHNPEDPGSHGNPPQRPGSGQPHEGRQDPYGDPNYGGQPYGGEPGPYGDPNYGGRPYGDPNYGGQPGPYGDPNYGGQPGPYGDPNYGGQPYGPPHGDPNYGGQPGPYGGPNYGGQPGPYGGPNYGGSHGGPNYGAPHGGGAGPMGPGDGAAQPGWRLGPGGWEPAAGGGNQPGPGNAGGAPRGFASGAGDVGKQGGEGNGPDAGGKTGGKGNGKLVAIIAAVVVLVLVVAGGAWALMSKETSEGTPTEIDALPMSGGTITSTTHTSCAVSEGDAYCWGLADEALINDREYLDNVDIPEKIEGLPQVESVWAGNDTVCAIDAEGAPYCWGNLADSMGMFRAGVTSDPVKIEGIRAREVRPGEYSSCAVDVDNAVWCWGSNRYGTLGIEENIKTTEPRRVPGLPEIRTLAKMPGNTVFALDVDGNVWGWGAPDRGLIPGVGDGEMRVASPVKIEGIPAMKTIAAGGIFGAACGVTEEAGEVWCWGSNRQGRMGQPYDDQTSSLDGIPAPVKIEGVSDVVAIDLDNSVVAVLADGTAVFWGENLNYTSGNEGEQHMVRPLEGAGNFDRVSVGFAHVGVVDKEGKIHGVGRSVFGFRSEGERLREFGGITVDS